MKKLAILFMAAMAVGCSSVPYHEPEDPQYDDPNDPFEPVNRDLWELNQTLDEHILRPVAISYRDNVNEGLRDGLYNMAQNLDEPATIINDILQLKLDEALENSGRFVINSTVGVLGFFDVADSAGLPRNQEDFGQTMGVYGIGNGPFLMVPAMGPTAVRGAVGDYADSLIWPVADLNVYFNVFRITVKALSTRIELVDQEALLENSLDSYSFVKNAYFSNLESKVKDGNVDAMDEDEEFDDFLDDFDDIDDIENLDESDEVQQ